MMLFISLILILLVTYFSIVNQKSFGKLPHSKRLDRIKKSSNYKNGAFQNQIHTPNFSEGENFFGVLYKYMTDRTLHKKPPIPIPHIKSNLFDINADENVLVWFGHSSYFMQIDGKKILVDPVLSGNAAPFTFSTKAFEGADYFKAAAIPPIDYLFISHDHWDHLDYKTMMLLQPKIKNIITGLGTGAHLEHWGFAPTMIQECDWNEHLDLGNGFMVHATPSRHFSGRTLTRNKALWLSFVLKTPNMNLYLGGDSGYGPHFKEIGAQFGPFDLAILENGQYDPSWNNIHLLPEEFLTVAKELKAKRVLPVHNSKFALAKHAWNDPLIKISNYNKTEKIPLITPKIGEIVYLTNPEQTFETWWNL